jgi:hypothetical protein
MLKRNIGKESGRVSCTMSIRFLYQETPTEGEAQYGCGALCYKEHTAALGDLYPFWLNTKRSIKEASHGGQGKYSYRCWQI